MKQTTLWIIVVWEKILLCMKKRWFWVWLWNWAGWKCEPGETISEAMIRELKEETWLTITQKEMDEVWVLHFFFESNTNWDQDVFVFKIKSFSWDPIETEEMKPQWFDIKDIPYDNMWEDDIIWLPRVLSWEKIEYDFIFWNDSKMKSYNKII